MFVFNTRFIITFIIIYIDLVQFQILTLYCLKTINIFGQDFDMNVGQSEKTNMFLTFMVKIFVHLIF